MHVVIFSYDREEMLKGLLNELINYEAIVIDDGSDWSKENYWGLDINHMQDVQVIRTHHEGKYGFWKKWVIARQLSLGTDHEYFLFLPDDVTDIDLEQIKAITQQGWEDRLFAMNLGNEGAKYRFGKRLTGQEPIYLNSNTWRECCYVDGMFLTNRRTLELLDINQVPDTWFKTKAISSGVGYQMTMTLRKMNAIMMRPDKSLVYHGDHESKMHKDERIKNPLITK